MGRGKEVREGELEADTGFLSKLVVSPSSVLGGQPLAQMQDLVFKKPNNLALSSAAY